MLSKQFIFLFTLSLLMLSACSSTKQSQMEEFFKTKIHADGSKRFTFSLVILQTQNHNKEKSQQRPNKPSKSNGNRKKGQNDSRNNKQGSLDKENSKLSKMTELFEERLQKYMANKQYCREGYITLETSFSGAIYTLRGECQESATDEDKRRFL